MAEVRHDMKQKYIVMVDDNFHFTDASERYKDSEHITYAEAVKKCQSIVDDYLIDALEPGMTSNELYASYTMFGEDPFIISNSSHKFSAWEYAKRRCLILCR